MVCFPFPFLPRYILPHNHDIPFPSLQLGVLPQQYIINLPRPKGGGDKELYTHLNLSEVKFVIFYFSQYAHWNIKGFLQIGILLGW